MIDTPTASLILAGASLILTAAIAGVTFYIAWQQKRIAEQQARTAKNTLSLHLFDRRLPVYEAAMKLAGSIVSKANVTREETGEFALASKSARFLFDEEIQKYCDQLHNEARLVWSGKAKTIALATSGLDPEESIDLVNKRVLWFDEQLKTEIPRRFAQFLHIEV